jgi:hypothetical protein
MPIARKGRRRGTEAILHLSRELGDVVLGLGAREPLVDRQPQSNVFDVLRGQIEEFATEYLAHEPEMMFRARESRLRVSDTIALERLDAVRRVAFRFDEDLDDRRTFRLLVMDREAMHEIPVPPIGAAIVLREAAVP